MSSDERERVTRLIEFLADLDAIRNPPVHDIAAYGVYLLRGPDLIRGHEAVRLDTQETEWLTVDFVDAPAVPGIPPQLAELLDPAEVRDSSRVPELHLPDAEDHSAITSRTAAVCWSWPRRNRPCAPSPRRSRKASAI